ncbi:type II secretory pathway pseudopilin PulG [Bradyrhizobium diazoefficiens]|jgi:hypothetical protein|uniref:Uncharacterized protein n=1 Tax=Bradyrhizobium barranii subsp. barranii TaxID=2823807 RepID=A0A7Z0Q402_9BRAD|nr:MULTISPECIES: hypothetical protein [Bradyrhizobium]MCP1790907.1 type II secretory pathway pseudopilin PulG [Bradyrhizobium japonicum]MCP1880019.1 type II secretory pathway pseudopilin PulG [Bradyrhizobium japonicum]MCP1934681.1 type II secretory pathway pseudopilin PulG [Bradyrhizobium japonicum]MCP1947970.1 type II secretory pathway pseudopilin PulG [Bradyrhizobium japonicum]MCS3544501.1 type II secretory pathway pseudopilin PulG [Bradyrhizobium japonicum]
MITMEEGVALTVVGLVGSAVGYVIRNAIAHTKNEASAKAGQAIANEAKAAAAEAHRLAAATERELSQFREKVALEYATIHLIDRLEERLVRSLDRIGERFDAFLTSQSGKAS